MNIGFLAAGSRKDLIENFCVAYKYILAKHTLFATEMTGRRIEQATNLKVHKFLSGSVGGEKYHGSCDLFLQSSDDQSE